jgi:hypothetical protein
MTAPSRATIAGQTYLDLRRKARQDRRPVDELIQLYVLEGFLARLAFTRGTVNTRWRDFADIYLLTRRHPVDGTDLCRSVREVARHRRVELRPLAEVLLGYGDIGQQRWAAWRAKQQLSDRLPEQFHDVVTSTTGFADPAITRTAAGHS